MAHKRVVAVEDGLSPVFELLQRRGYRPVRLEAGQLDEVDAIVVSGMDTNLANRQDILARVPVISAEGRTAEEVFSELSGRLA